MKTVKRWARRAALLFTAVGGVVLIAVLLVSWWFPNLDQHKTTIEHFVSQEVRQPVVIQQLETEWRGLHLSFLARGVRVRGVEGTQSALRIGELRLEVEPLPLLLGKIRMRSLSVNGLTLELIRTTDGQIRISDLTATSPDPEAGQAAVDWLFRQQSVRLGETYFVWRDEREPNRALQLNDVELTMQERDGERIISGSARFPAALGSDLEFSGTVHGIPLVSRDWGGVIEFSFAQLNIAALPLAVAEMLPWRSEGRMKARLSTSFVNGRPVGGVGELTVLDFEIPFHETQAPLAAKRLHSEISWHQDGPSWRVLLLHPELELDRVLAVDQLEIDWMPDAYTFRVENVDLSETVAAVRALQIKLPWQYVLDRVKPAGVVRSARLTVEGVLRTPRDWHFEGEFADLAWAPYRLFPGLSGVHGRMQLDKRQGRLMVRDGDVELDFPQVLREPLRFPKLNGNIAWSRDERNWSVHVTDIALRNPDIQVSAGSVLARLPVEPGPSPYIDAQAQVDRLNLASVRHYLPAKLMKPKAIKWADHAFAGGRATGGHFRLKGYAKDFPFQDDSGEFRVTAKVHDGVLVYDTDWPAVKDIQADVTFDNEWIRVTSDHARIYNSPVTNVVMNSNELFLKKKPRVISIDGEMRARVADVVRFLTKGPLIKQKDAMPDMTGAGEGLLSLKLDLPIGRLKESSQVAGTYRFDDAELEFKNNGIGLSQLQGQIAFTEKTVTGESLQGRMLDGPVQLSVHSVKPQKPPHFAIDFAGQGNIKRLAPILSHSVVGFLDGAQVPWQARLEVDGGRADLSVRSDGLGLKSSLPRPLAKGPGARWQITARTRFSREGRDIEFNVAERLRGILAMRKRNGKVRFDRGRITLNRGRAELPREPGLQVIAGGADVDADQWIEAWRRSRDFSAKGPDAVSDEESLIDHLRLFRMDARDLKFLDRQLGTMQIEAHSGDSLDWVARLNGPAASGAARLRFSRRDNAAHDFKFVLDRFYWPRAPQTTDDDQSTETESPAEYPRLAIDANDFRYGDWQLGRARIRAAPDAQGWRIENFTTDHDALQLSGSGLWHENVPGQQTKLQIEFRSNDVGQALTLLGHPDQLAGGEGALLADLHWAGSPGRFGFARLNGAVELEVKKGRFLQVNPGTGRLMGLFNVDALARRVTLDFTDVFSKGLAFDRINAKGRIAHGDLYSDGTYIVGPAAMIEARGRAGLEKEDYDMELIIAPDLGGNLTLLSALANPAAGAVVFVMQKLFKKQLAKMVYYRYQVSGPWDNPHVVKLRQDPVSEAGDENVESEKDS